jgi:hypothetical protein
VEKLIKELIYPSDRIIDWEKKIFKGESFVWKEAINFRNQKQPKTTI